MPVISACITLSAKAPAATSAKQVEPRHLRQKLERAQMEREIQESRRHLLEPAGLRSGFIEDRRTVFPVRAPCLVLHVSASGHYA